MSWCSNELIVSYFVWCRTFWNIIKGSFRMQSLNGDCHRFVALWFRREFSINSREAIFAPERTDCPSLQMRGSPDVCL